MRLRLKDSILRILEVISEPSALAAIATWPVFSITSYQMLRGLARQEVAPRTIIDVGANIGQFAVAAVKTFPAARVYTIEANPESFNHLCRNIRKLKNASAFQAAVGDREGIVELHINAHSHSSSLLELAPAHRAAFPYAVELGTVQVKATTLDTMFAGIELQPPVLLKLDVQGYEAQALRGAVRTLQRVDYTVLEASFRPMYEGETLFLDLVRIMLSHSFRFSRPVGLLHDSSTGEILQMDALFERADSSLRATEGMPDRALTRMR
jgi:FkbM family methyltransferase